MARSRILPIQTQLHFAGLAIEKMQAALGRPGLKPTRPGSLSEASLVVPQLVWDTIGPGVLVLAKAFGLDVMEQARYHLPPGNVLVEFSERSRLTQREQLVRWFNKNDNAWAGVGRIGRDIRLDSLRLARVFWRHPDVFESRPSRCSWHEYRLRQSPDPGAGKPPFAAASRVGRQA